MIRFDISLISDKTKAINYYRNEFWILYVIILAVTTAALIVHEKWYFALLIFSPILIYLCINKPFIFPLGLYALLLPFDPILSITGSAQGATLTKVLGILTIIVFLFKGVFEHKLIRPDKALVYMLVFILYMLGSVLWAIEPEEVASLMPTVAGLFSLYLVTSSYKVRRSELDTLRWCILIGGFLAAIYSIYSFISGNFEEGTRSSLSVTDRFTNPNWFALSLIFPFSVCVHMILENKLKSMRIVLGAALGCILFGIIITGSRGGLMGSGVVVVTYILYLKQKISFITVVIIIGIIISTLVPSVFFDRWSTALESGGTGRTAIWYVGWKALGKYWLYGAGLNNFPTAFNEFYHFASSTLKISRAPHNLFIGLLVESGIFGLSFLILSLVKHFKALNFRNANHKLGGIMLKASFAGVLTHSMFLDSAWTKTFWIVLMMIMMYRNMIKVEWRKEQNSFHSTKI